MLRTPLSLSIVFPSLSVVFHVFKSIKNIKNLESLCLGGLTSLPIAIGTPLRLEKRRCFSAKPCFLFYHFNNKKYPNCLSVLVFSLNQ